MTEVNQCPFCDVRERSLAELEIHLASDHPGRVWNDRMPNSVEPATGVDDDQDGDETPGTSDRI